MLMALNNLSNVASILVTGAMREIDESKAGALFKLVTCYLVLLLVKGLFPYWRLLCESTQRKV